MQNYELLLILPGTLSEDEVDPLVEKVSKTIEDAGGTNVSVEKIEKRRLAYPIKHIRYGYFNLAYFEAEPEVSVIIQKKLLLISELLRVLIQKHDPEKQKNRTIKFGLPMQNKDDLVSPRRASHDRSATTRVVSEKAEPTPTPEKEVESEEREVEVVSIETTPNEEVVEVKPDEKKVEEEEVKEVEKKEEPKIEETKSEGGKEKLDMDDIDKKLDDILDIDLSNV